VSQKCPCFAGKRTLREALTSVIGVGLSDGTESPASGGKPFCPLSGRMAPTQVAPGLRASRDAQELVRQALLVQLPAAVRRRVFGGLSQKGPAAGNASHYYSLTNMITRGAVTIGETSWSVEGKPGGEGARAAADLLQMSLDRSVSRPTGNHPVVLANNDNSEPPGGRIAENLCKCNHQDLRVELVFAWNAGQRGSCPHEL
jgi:hypothetical protein